MDGRSAIAMRLRGHKALCPVAIAVAVVLAGLVAVFVDLAPQVQRDFFFAGDDAAGREDEAISRIFPAGSQVIISARGDLKSPRYYAGTSLLTDELAKVPGVTSVQSVTRGPKTYRHAFESAFWRRLLIGEDGTSTVVVVLLHEEANRDTLSRIEEVATRHSRPAFEVHVSGVPYVVELIRRSLVRDLIVFSSAAIIVFGLIITVVFRSLVILLGAMVSCVCGCCATLLALRGLDVRIGVLTVNVATIVFIMTLHHVIYLTFAWKEAAEERASDRASTVAQAVGSIFAPSCWVMVTTLLGFASLMLVKARPLRELGSAGAIGAVIALCAAYLVYPSFLHLARRPAPAAGPSTGREHPIPPFLSRPYGWAVIAAVVVAAILASGILRLDKDPSLLSYFSRGGEIREGLEYIDRNGGSSPLRIVVRDRSGAALSTKDGYRRLWKLQMALERHPTVGAVISLPLIMAEGKRAPFGALFTHRFLLERMESPKYGRVTHSFVSEDRTRGLFVLRMKESVERESRLRVVEALEDIVRDHQFEPEMVGGLFFLQGQLSHRVTSSLITGVGQLLFTFLIVAVIVSRSLRWSAAMLVTLALIPGILLGLLGYLRVPLDIISAPAVNIALGMAIDDMIHLAAAARRFHRGGRSPWEAWVKARAVHWKSVVGTMATVSAGFAIFAFSSFPPTQRFGLAAVGGSLLDIVTCLVILPFLAAAPLSKRRARLHSDRRAA